MKPRPVDRGLRQSQRKRQDLSRCGHAENDAGGKADQQVIIVDLDPLLTSGRLAQTIAMIVADLLAALPLGNVVALGPFVAVGCRTLGVVAIGAGLLCLMTLWRGFAHILSLCRWAGFMRLRIMLIAARAVMAALGLCHRNGKHGDSDDGQDRTLEHFGFLVGDDDEPMAGDVNPA